MEPVQYLVGQLSSGLGSGWSRVADAVVKQIPRDEIDRLWVFRPMRREQREWGTAVIAQRTGERRLRVFTARYMLIVRGRERGQGKVEVEEVGESPTEIIYDVIRGVQDRAGETEPPVEISPELWYGDDDDESASQA